MIEVLHGVCTEKTVLKYILVLGINDCFMKVTCEESKCLSSAYTSISKTYKPFLRALEKCLIAFANLIKLR